MVPFASYVSRGQSKPYKRINGPIVGMLLFFQLICMICGREGHGAECMVRAQKLHSEQRSFLLPWLHSRIPGADGKAPGYRLSPDHFQTVNRMIAPDWAQKMLCIIVPNRRTASPEKFISVRSSYGNLSLFEVTRASVLFSQKFKQQFKVFRKW